MPQPQQPGPRSDELMQGGGKTMYEFTGEHSEENRGGGRHKTFFADEAELSLHHGDTPQDSNLRRGGMVWVAVVLVLLIGGGVVFALTGLDFGSSAAAEPGEEPASQAEMSAADGAKSETAEAAGTAGAAQAAGTAGEPDGTGGEAAATGGPAKIEEPKAEEPKAEEPKAEEPKAEEPKKDAPNTPAANIPANNAVPAKPAKPAKPSTPTPGAPPGDEPSPAKDKPAVDDPKPG